MLKKFKIFGFAFIGLALLFVFSCGGGQGTSGGFILDKALVAPSILLADARNEDTIFLTWQDNSENEMWFLLERTTTTRESGDVNEGTFEIIKNDIPRNTQFFADTNLEPDTTYFYRIRARSEKGVSLPSMIAEAKTKSLFSEEIPPRPDLKRVEVLSSKTLRPVWEVDQSIIDRVDGYRIYRSLNGIDYSCAASTGTDDAGSLSCLLKGVSIGSWGFQYYYEDSGLTPDTMYYYKIASFNLEADSPLSVAASARTEQSNYPEAPLMDNIAKLGDEGAADRRFYISWTVVYDENDEIVEDWTLERNENGGAFSPIVDNYTEQNYNDYMNGLNPGSVYCYHVAWNIGDEFAWSDERCATADLAEPDAPVQNDIVRVSSEQLDISWSYALTPDIEFNVYRRTGSTSYSCIASSGIGSFATGCALQGQNMGGPLDFVYHDNGLNYEETYYYVVTVFNDQFESEYSNVKSASPPNPSGDIPASPTNLRYDISSVSLTSVDLIVNDNATNETGFRVEYDLGSGNWQTLANGIAAHSGTGDYMFTLGNLSVGTEYTVRVYAYNYEGEDSANPTNSKTFSTKSFETNQFEFNAEYDVVSDIAVHNDKVFMVGATSEDDMGFRDIVVVRFNSAGQIEDMIRFDDPSRNRTPTGIAVSNDGASVFVSAYDSTDELVKMVFLKLNANNLSDSPFERVIGDPDTNRSVWATDIAVDASNNLYAVAHGQVQFITGGTIPNDRDIWLLQLSPSNLTIVSAKQHDSVGKDENGTIATYTAGEENYVYVGATKKIDGSDWDLIVLRFNVGVDGNVDRDFRRSVEMDKLDEPVTDDQVSAITVDGSGFVYVAGNFHPDGDYSDYDIFLYKLNSEMAQVGDFPIFIDRQSEEYPGFDRADDVVCDGENNVYLLTHIQVPPDNPYGRQDDIAIFKFNSSSQTQWEVNYATDEDDWGVAFGYMNADAIYFGADSFGRLDGDINDAGDSDAVLSRIDRNGIIAY